MSKTLTAVLFLLISNLCFSQHITFPASPYLKVSLPDYPDSMRLGGNNIYYLNTDTIFYQIGVQDSLKLKVKTKEDFAIALKGMYHGYSPKLADYIIQKVDTTFYGREGLYIYAISKDTAV